MKRASAILRGILVLSLAFGFAGAGPNVATGPRSIVLAGPEEGVSFRGGTPATDNVMANSVVEIPYISQYQGLCTSNCDCGPASAAMVLQKYGKRPPGYSDAQWVEAVRNKSGNTGCYCTPTDHRNYLTFPQLEAALTAYGGLTVEEIPPTLSPQPDAQMQKMKEAIAAGKPVIALVHGATLGRGSNYGDHFVVVRGFSDDGQSVYVNDPDYRCLAGWLECGGPRTWSYSRFKAACYQAAYGPYGVIVGAQTATSCPPAGCTPGRDVGRDFFEQVVSRLNGVSMSGFAVDALVAWKPYENTAACWNPLATTWRMEVVCNFNSVGVQHYQNQDMGVRATANTLNLSYYEAIRKMLRLEAFDREGLRAALSTWGTCSGAGCDSLLNRWQELWNARGGCPLTSIPSGYHKCADENGRCNFSGTANVIYGANNCYTSPRSFSNGVDCNNGVFGDPVPGVVKACYTNASTGCNNPSPNNDQIGLYEHADYCGAYKILGIGEYPNPGAIGLANDSISSVKVGSNVKALLCKHDGFQDCEEFLNNDPNLSDNPVGNDSVSSVKVQPRTTTCPVPSPSGPNGSRIPQTQNVNFTWSGSCSQYRVKYWGGPYSGDLYSGWVSGSPWTPGTLWCGNYSWQVQGKSSSGAETGWSTTLNFTVVPNTPTGLSASAVSQSQINLSWNGVAGDKEGYKVYRNGAYIGSTGATTYQVTGLSCGTTYSFFVKAYKGSIESDPSNTASATTHACPPNVCPAPGNLTATALSQTSIRLNWQDTCGNEDSFQIFRNGTQVGTVGAGTTTWTDNGLSCGTTYSYSVKAHNAGGDSPTSNTASATTHACSPGCPGGDAGNDFSGATQVYPPAERSEYICPADDQDWYRFSVNAGQTIQLSLSSLPGDYDLYLYRPNATQAASSTAGGTTDESITFTADASGEWRAKVVGWNGAFSATDSYVLRVQVQSQQTQKISLEAELGSLTSPMAAGSHSQASSCGYVSSPQGNQGAVELRFSVAQAGNYYFWARGMGLSDYNENSLWASVDGGARYHYEIPAPGGQWHWSRLFQESGNAAPLWLTAGEHTIRFDGREQGARLDKVVIVNSVDYQPAATDVVPCTAPPTPTATPTRTRTPTPTPVPPPNSWRAEYFNNETLSGSPAVVKYYTTTYLDFEWADGRPEPGVNADHFSARFRRTVTFGAGRYKFTVFRDDGARLYVDGTRILDEWRWGRAEHLVEHNISAGNHEIVLEVYEIDGWATAKLSWQMIGGSAPNIVSIQPSCGRSDAGGIVNFQTVASDPDGWQDIKIVYFTVNTAASRNGGVTVAYNAELDRMVMWDDVGAKWLVGGPPGSNTALETSRARLNIAASNKQGAGNELRLNWNLQFKSEMNGSHGLYLLVLDKSGRHTGWQAVGSWGVGTNGSPPCVGSVNPAAGQSNAGAQALLQAEFSDLDGWEDLKIAYMLIGPVPNIRSDSVYLAYNQDVNKIFLGNDQNSAWLGGFAPGTNATIQNSNVVVDVAGCSVSHTAQGLTVQWALRFKNEFRGTYNVYAATLDNRGYATPWQRKGTWTIQ